MFTKKVRLLVIGIFFLILGWTKSPKVTSGVKQMVEKIELQINQA